MAFSDDYDIGAITAFIVLLVIGLSILIGTIVLLWNINHHHNIAPYKEECASNPRLRYAENCTTIQNCIDKCAERLYKEK